MFESRPRIVHDNKTVFGVGVSSKINSGCLQFIDTLLVGSARMKRTWTEKRPPRLRKIRQQNFVLEVVTKSARKKSNFNFSPRTIRK